MFAAICLCGAVVLNGIDRLITRRTLRDVDLADGFLLVYQLLSTALSLPLAAIALAGETPARVPADPRIWWAIPVCIALWSVYSVTAFRSARLLELSVSATISRLRIVLTAILGAVLFGEHLGPLTVAGIVVLLGAGVPLLRMPGAPISPRGAGLALLSAVAITLALLTDKLLTRVLPPACIAAIGFLGTALVALVLNVGRSRGRGRSWSRLRPILVPAAIAGTAGTLGYIALVTAMASGSASILLPIYQAAGILYVVAGIWLLGERVDRGRKLTAAAIAAVGAGCLAASPQR